MVVAAHRRKGTVALAVRVFKEHINRRQRLCFRERGKHGFGKCLKEPKRREN